MPRPSPEICLYHYGRPAASEAAPSEAGGGLFIDWEALMFLPPLTPSEGDAAIALLSRQLLPVLWRGSHPSLQPSGPSS